MYTNTVILNDHIRVYQGTAFIMRALHSMQGCKKVIVFDLDETLGSFSDLCILWMGILKYSSNLPNKQDFFNQLLDLYPEFLRTDILKLLSFLYRRKQTRACSKLFVYTNNQCDPSIEWVSTITRYFDYKLNCPPDKPVFDHIIRAFMIGNQRIEFMRSTHEKTYEDFLKCTLLPRNTEICFIDNTQFDGMLKERVYYIRPKSYFHGLSGQTVLMRLQKSKLLSGTVYGQVVDFYKANVKCEPTRLSSDKLVAEKIMYYLREFFYLSSRKPKTRKIHVNLGRFTRKRKKLSNS